MNKQRKVLITITYNEMGIITDTKAEEVIQPETNCSEIPNSSDTISRQQAIDALDCISRQAALDALDKRFDNIPMEQTAEILMLRKDLRELPTIQPEVLACGNGELVATPEPQWILCDERMPEEHEWIGTKKFGTTISDEVYVTFENEKGERFRKHIRFQNGKLNSADQHTIDAIYKGSKPIAWMPLPEAYKPNNK